MRLRNQSERKETLSSKTMEAKRVPELYFIGEVVDVTGHLGGFNLQWAWASGFVAGQAVRGERATVSGLPFAAAAVLQIADPVHSLRSRMTARD
jgi:hypothetical protein